LSRFDILKQHFSYFIGHNQMNHSIICQRFNQHMIFEIDLQSRLREMRKDSLSKFYILSFSRILHFASGFVLNDNLLWLHLFFLFSFRGRLKGGRRIFNRYSFPNFHLIQHCRIGKESDLTNNFHKNFRHLQIERSIF